MATMEFVEEIGYFDEETFLYFEELTFGWQMRDRGRHGCLVTRVVVDHIQGSTSKPPERVQNLHVPRGRSKPGILRSSFLQAPTLAIWALYAIRATDYLVRSVRYRLHRREG